MSDYNNKYKILLIDDDNETIVVTKLVLSDYKYKNTECEILTAENSQEAMDILTKEDNIAVAFIDVVMEEHDSGLKLVKFIRNTLKNSCMRIIIRTGQPGYAPEDEVIINYEINDYLLKSDITSQRLKTSLTTAIRAYEQQRKLEINKVSIERVILLNNKIFSNKDQDMSKLFFSSTKELLFDMNLLSSVDISLGKNNIIKYATGVFSKHINSNLNSINFIEHITPIFNNIYYSNKNYYYNNFYNSHFIFFINKNRSFYNYEIEIFDLLTSNLSILLENFRLDAEKLNAHKEILLTLSEVIENKSNETVYHVHRVADISYELGKLYGLNKKDLNLLKIVAPMHDVGKIGVPDNILNKPAKLTNEEFEIIKSHSAIGYKILKDSKNPILKVASTIAHEHHERWDGKGYPQQKKGEEINILARIVAIADVFDALINERVYKKAWSEEKVYNYYKEMKEIQFDPELTEIFINNFDKFILINNKFG